MDFFHESRLQHHTRKDAVIIHDLVSEDAKMLYLEYFYEKYVYEILKSLTMSTHVVKSVILKLQQRTYTHLLQISLSKPHFAKM